MPAPASNTDSKGCTATELQLESQHAMVQVLLGSQTASLWQGLEAEEEVTDASKDRGHVAEDAKASLQRQGGK